MLGRRVGWVLAFATGALFAACGGSTTTAGGPPDAGPSSSGSTGTDGSSGSNGGSTSGSVSSSGTPAGQMAFVIDTILLGESTRAGVKNKDAWKDYGRDIDGLTTVVTSPSAPDLAKVCKRKQGAPALIHNDGNGGIDNAWGKEVMKLIDPFAPTPSTVMTGEIFKGARTGMISLDGKSGSFVIAEQVASNPTFDPAEVRAVAAESMSNGTPKALIVNGGITASGVYDSGPIAGELLMAIFPDVLVPLHAARITMTIAADGSRATVGTISGVVETEVLVTQFAKAMGRMSPELCSGSTVEGIKESIRQASDILKDGTQDPNVECDGISIGLGFEATRGVVGTVAPAPQPTPDPCQ